MICQDTIDMLDELADLLDTLPRKRFDYRVWVGAGWKGAWDLSCGTVACAGGWATTLPSFRKRGLLLIRSRGVVLSDGSPGIVALATVLRIPEDHCTYLFVPGYPQPHDLSGARVKKASPHIQATPKQVAKHIRRYVSLRSREAS